MKKVKKETSESQVTQRSTPRKSSSARKSEKTTESGPPLPFIEHNTQPGNN